MLTRLAHLTIRHRRAVIGIWVVLTLFGAFAAGKVSTRWYQSLSVPGKPAYEASQRTLKALGVGPRPPSVVVFHTSGDATKDRGDQAGDAPRRRHDARRAHELVLLDRQPDVCLARPAHDVRRGVSAGRRPPGCPERCAEDARRGRERPRGRDHRQRDRPRSARGSQQTRLQRRFERSGGGGDRRSRRARHPAVRVRDACRRC